MFYVKMQNLSSFCNIFQDQYWYCRWQCTKSRSLVAYFKISIALFHTFG